MKTNWLSHFLKRLQRGRNLSDGGQAASPPEAETVKQIVRAIVSTRADEIGCDACFEQVDRFADMMLDGKDAAEVLPLVQDHLDRCNDCREEFEALLTALQAVA